MKKRLRGMLLFFAFPILISLQAQEYGLASFYSDEFDGRSTAYGEIYDKDKMTCAHKKHGLGTILRVTRLDNKKSVEVRVNDKGPYIKGRVVDLSKAAARKLGLTQDGVVEVKVEVVGKTPASAQTQPKEEKTRIPETRPEPAEVTSPRIATEEPEPSQNTSSRPEASTEEAPKRETRERETTAAPSSSTSRNVSTTSSAQYKLVTNDYTPYGLYRIRLERPTQSGFGVQVVSLTNYENVLRQVADLQTTGFDDILVSVEPDFDGTSVYKIILGNFDTMAKAKSYQSSLKKRYKLNGFVVDLSE